MKEEGRESRGETSGKKRLSWQDEWKIKLQNERLLKRAAPNLLPTQANLYFWNQQKGCQLKPMLESPCSKCSTTHVQSGGGGMNLGFRVKDDFRNSQHPIPKLPLQYTCSFMLVARGN